VPKTLLTSPRSSSRPKGILLAADLRSSTARPKPLGGGGGHNHCLTVDQRCGLLGQPNLSDAIYGAAASGLRSAGKTTLLRARADGVKDVDVLADELHAFLMSRDIRKGYVRTRRIRRL